MQVFSWTFSEMFKNNFFTEHIRTTASGHFHSLNNWFFFFSIQWTNRNQAFYICEHDLSRLSSAMNIMSIWKTLRNKRPIETTVRLCFSEKFHKFRRCFLVKFVKCLRLGNFYKSPLVAASWPSYCCIGRRISLRHHMELVW